MKTFLVSDCKNLPVCSNVFSFFNQKGGVGKTTTSINIAACLGLMNKKVLLIDFDPQANATTGMGVKNRSASVHDFLFGKSSFRQVISKTCIQNVDIIPSSQDLSAAFLDLVQFDYKEFFLKYVIREICSLYDYVFIDCPPSMCLLSLNALVASAKVIIPLQAEYYALEGLSRLIQNAKLIKEEKNKDLEIEGIILTMFDKRNSLSFEVENDVRSHLGRLVYESKIFRSVRVSESPSFGKPLVIYDSKNFVSDCFFEASKEFLNRGN
ncbi:ParA family protein [Candidatus Gromoviella agglomerans]|uniref:ParA family protein n=1 Tax=Candidatus Gromoviella agglomerans TaxID=2806609 RepID=UPI001E4EF204|nr:ParA family protein [Candidatus Gromoviella agglomerans]UFX98443.1 ParA family protein [Candidatus Gromoviella agglomerans]